MIAPLSRFRRWLKRATTVAVAATVVWLALSVGVAYKLTRRPHPRVAEPAPAITWATIEPVRLHTSDGLELGAWFMPCSAAGPSVLVLHGLRRDRGEMLPLAEMLMHEGCSVMAVSMRAYGDSDGDTTDFGYSSRHDVVAAVDWLEKRRPGKPIFVQGTSMGAAAAVFAADELKMRVSGYVLECPYRDIRSAVRTRTSSKLPWPLDRVAYAGLDVVGPIFLPEMERMSPLEQVSAIPQSVPVLVIAGGRDDRARPEDVKAIYERIASHAWLIVFPDAGHGQYQARGGEKYRTAVVELLHKK